MACVSGTNIVNDGLVFHFDLENGVKSFKGKPTSNLIETNLLNYTKDNGCTVEATGEYYQGMPTYSVTFNYGTLPRIRTNFSYTNGVTYSGSIYYRVVSQGSHTPKLYFREVNFGASYTEIALFSTSWARAKITHTFTTASSTAMFLLYQATSSSTSSTVIEFAMPQTEVGDIATKFTSGIRLDTASIIDLAPNKQTITAANLSYRQDDTPTFDGVNDYLSTPTLGILDAMSIEVWVYSSENKYASIAGDFSTITDSVGMRLNWRLQGAVWVEFGEAGIGNSVQTNVNINEWYHIVGIATNNDSVKMYINGQFIGSTPTTKAFTGGLPLYIGRGDFGEYFHGEISQVKIYNRALTATEIKQNFESTRSRYGI